jgi:predicted heme/steroid binding protein
VRGHIFNTQIYDLSLSWLGNDTTKTQIYDLSLSWLGNDTPNTQIYDLSLSWLGNDTGEGEVIHVCFRAIVTKPVPSQESERSYTGICVLRVSVTSLCQARKVRGHIFVL